MDKNLIPEKLYRKIVELMPIFCVDVVLYYEGKFVLVKRATEPLKGHWWVIGGRAYKNETSLQTAKRKIKEEVGLQVYDLRLHGIYEDKYGKSAWGVPTSCVSLVYLGLVKKYKPRVDKTSTGVGLFKLLPARFTKKLKRIK